MLSSACRGLLTALWLVTLSFPFVSPPLRDTQRFMPRADLHADHGAGFDRPLSPVPGGGSQRTQTKRKRVLMVEGKMQFSRSYFIVASIGCCVFYILVL